MRDGHNFAIRYTDVRQKDKTVLTAVVQFHRPEPSHGLFWQPTMPRVPPPEALADLRELLSHMCAQVPLASVMLCATLC